MYSCCLVSFASTPTQNICINSISHWSSTVSTNTSSLGLNGSHALWCRLMYRGELGTQCYATACPMRVREDVLNRCIAWLLSRCLHVLLHKEITRNNRIACTKTDKLAFATFETQFCLRVAPFSCCTLGSSTCATGKLSASRPTHTEPTPRPVCSPCDCGVKAARVQATQGSG